MVLPTICRASRQWCAPPLSAAVNAFTKRTPRRRPHWLACRWATVFINRSSARSIGSKKSRCNVSKLRHPRCCQPLCAYLRTPRSQRTRRCELCLSVTRLHRAKGSEGRAMAFAVSLNCDEAHEKSPPQRKKLRGDNDLLSHCLLLATATDTQKFNGLATRQQQVVCNRRQPVDISQSRSPLKSQR